MALASPGQIATALMDVESVIPRGRRFRSANRPRMLDPLRRLLERRGRASDLTGSPTELVLEAAIATGSLCAESLDLLFGNDDERDPALRLSDLSQAELEALLDALQEVEKGHERVSAHVKKVRDGLARARHGDASRVLGTSQETDRREPATLIEKLAWKVGGRLGNAIVRPFEGPFRDHMRRETPAIAQRIIARREAAYRA